MRFDAAQLHQYETKGYVIVECPFPRELTDACQAAAERVAQDPQAGPADGNKRNHYRLRPQLEGSYWCALDHSLPFLRVMLHPEILELARQLQGDDDIYLRNGGINDQGPDRSVQWHRDGGVGWPEFMHYFAGASRANGCLRVVPGSHLGDDEPWERLARDHRERAGNAGSASDDGWEDVELPDEVSLEVEPHQLVVRSAYIFHSTWMNRTTKSRVMSHWLFHPHTIDDHHFTWRDYLTPELIKALTPEQREVLWLDREFSIHPKFEAERERELGSVSWGIV